jgi:uncharacterized membrane protein
MAATTHNGVTARTRLVTCLVAGVATAIIADMTGYGQYAMLAGWDMVALLYTFTVLVTVLGFDSRATKSHALSENPGRLVSDGVLLTASLASLFAVGLLVLRAGSTVGVDRLVDIGLGLVSVILSWAVTHTIYTLTYARMYYGDPEGGIDFNEADQPRYLDFAYLAFTVGMTFQVSDTVIKTKPIRAAILRHALLAYVFGTVIIASTINFLVGLGK